jgi:hypothetical protein
MIAGPCTVGVVCCQPFREASITLVWRDMPPGAAPHRAAQTIYSEYLCVALGAASIYPLKTKHATNVNARTYWGDGHLHRRQRALPAELQMQDARLRPSSSAAAGLQWPVAQPAQRDGHRGGYRYLSMRHCQAWRLTPVTISSTAKRSGDPWWWFAQHDVPPERHHSCEAR